MSDEISVEPIGDGGLSLLRDMLPSWMESDAGVRPGIVAALLARLDASEARAAAAERERDELRAAQQWQPIETAPLDGSDILILAHGMVIEARYSAGEWSDDTPIHPAEYDGAVWVCFDDAVQFEIEETSHDQSKWLHGPVTHWQPLPAPPQPR